MTNLITLTIPNDDHIALRAFGKALEEMALAHGALLRVNPHVDVEKLREAMGNVEPTHIIPEVDTTVQQVESLVTHVITSQEKVGDPVDLGDGNLSQGYRIEMQELPTTDSTSTPWDERIHSTSKALNADGTWRLRRKPKDMDETEWTAFVDTIKLELTHGEEIREAMGKAERGEAVYYTSEEAEQKMEEFKESVRQLGEVNKGVTVISQEGVEVVTEELCIDEGCDHHGMPHICITPEPPVTPPGDDFYTDADVVTEQTVVGILPLPVPPPVVVAPPVPEVTTWDFPCLMTFLTERHGKIDVATVNTLLAQDGMSSVQELNAHPDKIGPFVARVKAHLGE